MIAPRLLEEALPHLPEVLKASTGDAVSDEDYHLSGEEAVRAWFANQDHGYPHFVNVWAVVSDLMISSSGTKYLEQAYLVCLFHDFLRSCLAEDASSKTRKLVTQYHGRMASILLQRAFPKLERLDEVSAALVEHEFFSPRLNQRKTPDIFVLCSWADICRLADRVSNPPVEEVERYWATGKKYGTPFFDSDVPFEDRCTFDLSKGVPKDELTFLLAMLSVEPKDFCHELTQDYYGQWEYEGKPLAVTRILEIAEEQECDVDEVAGIIERVKDELALLW